MSEQLAHAPVSSGISDEIRQGIAIQNRKKGSERLLEWAAQTARGRHNATVSFAIKTLNKRKAVFRGPNNLSKIDIAR